MVGRDDYADQLALNAIGGSLRDIIKLNYYCVDISHMPEFALSARST